MEYFLVLLRRGYRESRAHASTHYHPGSKRAAGRGRGGITGPLPTVRPHYQPRRWLSLISFGKRPRLKIIFEWLGEQRVQQRVDRMGTF